MFRHSGPDHMLLHTVLKQKGARLNFTFTCESKSKIQDKKKFTKILSWEKIDPLRGDPAPSPTVPLLQCPQAPTCRDFSPPLQTLNPPQKPGSSKHRARGGSWQHSWSWRWCWPAKERGPSLMLVALVTFSSSGWLVWIWFTWWQRLRWWRPLLPRLTGLTKKYCTAMC